MIFKKNNLFSNISAEGAPIATFVIFSFIIFSGVGFLSSYQHYISSSQEDFKEHQIKLLQDANVKFKIENITSNDGFGNISFFVTNTGSVSIPINKLSYFVNETYLQNVIPTHIANTSKLMYLLEPSYSMLITYPIDINQEEVYTIELIHDSNVRLLKEVIPPYVFGESGDFSVQNNENHIISFQRSYAQVPALFMTPKSDNVAGNNPYVPIIHSINTTHANVSLCQDDGSATCGTTYVLEEVSYMIFDVNRTNQLDWIEIGYINASTNGGTTPITFSKTLSNAPYVFAQSQTYNINGFVTNGIGAHSWFPSTTTTGAGIIGCDHPGTGDSCSGTATEEFAYLAIDPTLQNISTLEIGTESIGNSAWTPISFSSSISNPQMLVMQNSDTGGQDPQYPWARSVTSLGADIRYCEADAGGVCHSHSDEIVQWLVVDEGIIQVLDFVVE